jgi:arginine-tRNA-protein transferase
MKHKPIPDVRFFFATAPLPCPYLPGRLERRVVTELVGRDAAGLHETLTEAGFRRSHGIAYAPACPDCRACVPVRVVVPAFQRTRSQRRVWCANAELAAGERPPAATLEQFDLFARYQQSRHAFGDMSKMDFLDYEALVEDTPVNSAMVEFRDPDRSLVGACLMDRMQGGLSAVYSFFDPRFGARSLGTYMVLWLIERARALGLDYVYLGYWIAGCSKMSYKARFQPLEAATPAGWVPFDGNPLG